ncbi:MAG: peptidase S8 [Nitrosomonadaceae bacterium]|nr:peptidase S8 [Nitrosomonadaceae bacterium]
MPPDHANSNPKYDFPDGVQSAKSSSAKDRSEKWAKGRILVMPRAGLPIKDFEDILKEHEGKARKIGQSNFYIVDVPEYTEEGVVAKLQSHSHFKSAELDHMVSPSMIPNDPEYKYSWHFSKIGAPTAWDFAQGAGITIAILDSGVAATHPDLKDNMIAGWNFYDNNSDTNDVFGHGTLVAGTAAAVTNNGIGISSIAGNSKILPLRVTDINGYGYISMFTSALIYAADNGARIANISFAPITTSDTVRAAAQYMKDKNGLVVTGGGNSGTLENYTVTTTMISVSATDKYDMKDSFSSYGDYITLAAPGTNMTSTWKDGTYGPVAGTSIASPVVGGVIALMMSANPQLGSFDIENLLFSTAVDLGSAGKDIYFGYGRVDAAAAVLAAKNATPTIDSTAPATSIIDPLGGATVSGLIPVDVDATDNVGVARVELWINNTNIATDTSAPFAFSWDTTGAANGTAKVEARAYDTTGNLSTASISVNVGNSIATPSVDTQAPLVTIVNPVAGNVTGTVTISTNASDNSSSAGITQYIYIDGVLATTGTGSTLSYSWNTRSKKIKTGSHTIQAIAKDAAGNSSSAYVTVNVK